MAKKKTLPSEVVSSEAYVKDFFDMVVPSTIKFNVDHFDKLKELERKTIPKAQEALVLLIDLQFTQQYKPRLKKPLKNTARDSHRATSRRSIFVMQ